MDLRGWDYTGRNLGADFHRQMRLMMYYLMMPSFTNHQTWGNPIQDALAPKMGVSSSGVVRTVKRTCENFGLINNEMFNPRTEINGDDLLTERGKVVYQTATLEFEVNESKDLDEKSKERALVYIKSLYEEAYCDALKQFYYDNRDGTYLSPLRATLRALKRYGRMDKWEWYLMNTCIRHDDDEEEEEQLNEYIIKYRNEEITFTMQNVVEKPKGHQYIPQYFEYAGLVHLIQRPTWSIADNDNHKDIKEEVLSDTFLLELHGGI